MFNFHFLKKKEPIDNINSLEKEEKEKCCDFDQQSKYDPKNNKKSYKDKDKDEENDIQIPKNKPPGNPNKYKPKVIGFDYSQLDSLLSPVVEKKKNIILLVTGSFNPIHRMHIELLNIAYRHLLSLNKYNIICGFISPSADCYVRKKKPPLIPFDLRCYMIKTAIEEYEKENKGNKYLPIFLHKWEGTHEYFIDFPDVIQVIQEQLYYYFKNIDIQLVYVCGMDLFLQCYDYFKQNVIVVDRKPYKNYKYKDKPEKLIYIIKDEKAEPLSSTSIRECYKKRDYIGIEQITFPEVAQMIITFYDKHFK